MNKGNIELSAINGLLKVVNNLINENEKLKKELEEAISSKDLWFNEYSKIESVLNDKSKNSIH